MSSSLGMIVPNIWKIKHVPNHQPVYIIKIMSVGIIIPVYPYYNGLFEWANHPYLRTFLDSRFDNDRTA